MEQMFTSVRKKILALPEETEVYCAHEYTASNIAFAIAVEPNNEQLQIYRDEVIRLRAQKQIDHSDHAKKREMDKPLLANKRSKRDQVGSKSNRAKWSYINIYRITRMENDF